MQCEIGGEFWGKPTGEPSMKIPYLGEKRFFLSGRTALYAVIDDILHYHACKTAYLPAYCCHTMVIPFLLHGLRVAFYAVAADQGFKSLIDAGHPCDIVLTMDYFGFRGVPATLPRAIHIHDVTHSLLSRPAYCDADYVFASFRKWGAVAGAGFAAKRNGEFFIQNEEMKDHRAFIELRERGYLAKEQYILQGIGEKSAFLKDFRDAEVILDTDFADYQVDRHSLSAAMRIPCGAEQRRKNAICLLDGLKECSIVRPVFASLEETDTPLFVPIIVKDGLRDALKQHLIKSKIYPPVHWPIHAQVDRESMSIYENELSLICDQRYAERDMLRQIHHIREFEAESC